MRTTALALALLILASPLAAAQDYPAAHHNYRIETVVGTLEHPWSLAFLPNGDMLVTERPGRLRIIRDGQLLDSEVAGLPEVYAQGQGGLLDVVLHPEFEENRFLYLVYSKPVGSGATTAVARGRFENDALSGTEDIFVANSTGGGHYGGRLAFDGLGYIYISVGDRQVPPRGDLEAHAAQDPSNHHGTINRLHDDGRIPSDNPFVGDDGVEASVWSFGHRNPQGLAVHPETGDLWSVEHGPQGGDELNRVVQSRNYGWPVIGYGVNYRTGSAIHEGTHRHGMEQPVHFWVPSIATSGLMIYTGDKFPGWRGNLFVGGMAGTQVARLEMDGSRVKREETLAQDIGRIRDIRQGPDGYIYLLVDAAGGPRSVVRMVPAS